LLGGGLARAEIPDDHQLAAILVPARSEQEQVFDRLKAQPGQLRGALGAHAAQADQGQVQRSRVGRRHALSINRRRGDRKPKTAAVNPRLPRTSQ